MKNPTTSKQDKKTDIETKVITNIYGLTLGCFTTSDQSGMQSNTEQKHSICGANSKRIMNTCK